MALDASELPLDVAFAAASTDDGNTALTIGEASDDGSVAPEEMKAQLAQNLDAIGQVGFESVTLPAGLAELYTFTAEQDGVHMLAQIYVLVVDDTKYVIGVVTPADLALDTTELLDGIVQSFRVEPGQAA